MADSTTPAEAAHASGGEIGLEAIVDGSPLGSRHAVILLICALVAAVDGFDTQSVALVAPAVSTAWHVDPSHFGMVFAAGLFGSLLGALAFGVIGDRYGRRPALLTAVGWFALVTLTTTLTSSLPSMALARFFTGLGLGGALPGIISLASEYAPLRQRSTLVSVMFCGFPLGAVIGGIASAAIVPALGWQGMFWVSGGITLLLLPVFARLLPESIRFLALKQDRTGIVRVLERMGWRHLWNGEMTAATPARHSRWQNCSRTAGPPEHSVVGHAVPEPVADLLPGQLDSAPGPQKRSGHDSGGTGGGHPQRRRHRWLPGHRPAERPLRQGHAQHLRRVCPRRTGHRTDRDYRPLQCPASRRDLSCRQPEHRRADVHSCLLRQLLRNLAARDRRGWAIGIGRIGSIIGPLMGGALIAFGCGCAVPVHRGRRDVPRICCGHLHLGPFGIGQAASVPRV